MSIVINQLLDVCRTAPWNLAGSFWLLLIWLLWNPVFFLFLPDHQSRKWSHSNKPQTWLSLCSSFSNDALMFLCLRYEVAGGIMFSGCPSVRLSVRPSVPSVRTSVRTSRSRDRVIWRTDWWIPAKLWSCMYLAEPMNWLDFGVTRSKVKGHRAHYVCKNCSWSRYLKNRLMDSC